MQRVGKKTKVQETRRIVKRLKKYILRVSLRSDLPRKRSGKADDKEAGDKIGFDYEELLENELKALKRIDTDAVMRNALITRVKKDGVLNKDDRIKAVMESLGNESSYSSLKKGKTSTELSTDKVEARIRSSKQVAEVMKSCVEGLRELVLGQQTSKKCNGDDAGDIGDDDADPAVDDAEESFTGEAGTGAGTDDERSQSDGFSDAGWISGSIGEADMNDDEEEGGVDSDWESGSVASGRKVQPAKKKVKTKSMKDLPQKAPVQPPQISSTLPSKSYASELPPLLSSYIGGDSSGGDHWSDAGDSVTKERKNRRGQRARRV